MNILLAFIAGVWLGAMLAKSICQRSAPLNDFEQVLLRDLSEALVDLDKARCEIEELKKNQTCKEEPTTT